MVTVSGGVVRLATRVADDPKSVGALLAFAVPRAANYFFGHLIMRGLSGSAGTLLQLEALTHALMSKLNAKSTPREEFRRQVKLANIQWGSFWPPFTNLAVIGIILTPVAPLVLIFVLLVFGLFWATFRYSILFVLEFEQETGGLLLPAAINQTFTGLYVMQICVAGIFFMSRDSTGRASCLWQGSFILVGLICTAVFQVWLNYTFRPLLYFAPMTSDVTMPDPARQEGCVLARETDSTRPPPSAPRDCKSASDDDVEIRATETFTYHKNRIRDLLDLSAYEREEVLKRAFLHPAARAEKVTVWIPQDVNCIGADELKHGTEAGLSYSDVGCKINRKGELIVEKLPPDFSSLDAMRL